MSECRHPCCGDTCRKKKEPKARTPIKRTAIKRVYKPKKKVDGLDEWFLSRAAEFTGICCNCGDCSPIRSGTYWKWAIGHIFPKEPKYGFPSIAMHPLNVLEFCIPCHTLFDRSLDVAHTMKCWPIAVAKFRQFENEITEKRKYLDLFKLYADESERKSNPTCK